MVSREQVVAKLKEIVDPHTGINVYDMDMIKDLKVGEDGVSLTFAMTSNFCPVGMQLGMALKRKLSELSLGRIEIKVENYLRAAELEALLRAG